MSAHRTSHAKWYCSGCSPLKELDHANACSECCGFTNVSEVFRARLVRVLDHLDNNPLTAIMADEIPEFRSALTDLTVFANEARA